MRYDASGGGGLSIQSFGELRCGKDTISPLLKVSLLRGTANMLEYLRLKKPKPHDHPEPEKAVEPEKAEGPVLTAEDEAFLHRIATEGTPPPLPERPLQHLPLAGETAGNESQVALFDGPQNIPLPNVPDTPEQELDRSLGDEKDAKGKGKAKTKTSKPLFTWSFHRRDSRDIKLKDKETTATDLMSVAEGLKAHTHEGAPEIDSEVKKEEEELTAVLDQLNLAAVNNRAFSISKESQELLRKYESDTYYCIYFQLTICEQNQVYARSERPGKRSPNGLPGP